MNSNAAIVDQLMPYFTPGVRRHGARSVWNAASVGEMIGILQSHSDVTDICVMNGANGNYRLEIFQGGHVTFA